jgi:cyanophycinase
LVIIGGGEDKVGNKVILEEVARFIGSGKLVITTVGSEEPREMLADYNRIFRSLGVRHIQNLIIQSHIEGHDEAKRKEFLRARQRRGLHL